MKKVVGELKDQPIMLNFLIAFFLYSVGVQSIILLATIYGKSEIGLSTSSLILTIIVIQLLGIVGAYLFSNLSKMIGNITTLKITIVIWALASLSAYFLDKDDPNVQLKFYVISGFIGLVDEKRGMMDYAASKAVELEWKVDEKAAAVEAVSAVPQSAVHVQHP